MRTELPLDLALMALAFVAAPGCIGTSPEDQALADLGPGGDGSPEHRPGQPCLACHSAEFHPGGNVFVIAGTIYERATDDDAVGLSDAQVVMTDKAGHAFTAITNRVGNFMVSVNTSLAAPVQRNEGRLRIPWAPVFPIQVTVSKDGVEKDMESLIWRDGSCAGCHRTSEAGADHVEKVWFTEVTP